MVVRSDLTFGQQASQLFHAGIEFGFEYPELYKEWHDKSNYVCLLQIESERELFNLSIKAEELNIPYVKFCEPDLNNSLTAICLGPGLKTKKLLSHLKLAFK